MSGLIGVVLAYMAVAAIAAGILLAPLVVVGLVLAALGKLLGISYDGKRFTKK